MVLLTGLQGRRDPTTGEIEVGVRKVDPLQEQDRVCSKFVPLATLEQEEQFYRILFVQPPPRLKLPQR